MAISIVTLLILILTAEERTQIKRKQSDKQQERIELALDAQKKRPKLSDRELDFGMTSGAGGGLMMSREDQVKKFEAIQMETEEKINETTANLEKEMSVMKDNLVQ